MELKKEQIQALIQQAMEAREKAYAPYSNFMVGAALLCADGKVYTGCNVESVSYSPTTCAERTALVKAVSEGERKFAAIAVVGGHAGGTVNENEGVDEYSAPCGVCRQFLYEFGKDIQVIVAKNLEAYWVHPLEALLPLGFGPEYLQD